LPKGAPFGSVWSDRAGLDPDEVVRRARLRLGEDRYRLLTNNCEHCCECCIRREHRSYQVDELSALFHLDFVPAALESVAGLTAALLALPK
jgi:hypothetical protein